MSLQKDSKFLSYVLRHNPAAIGIVPDKGGWVDIEDLLMACGHHGRRMTYGHLMRIVASNEKQRFSVSPDGIKIRANQGHSIDVDLGYAPTAPPEILYHGTAAKNLPQIKSHGLTKQCRHHVHLCAMKDAALEVGRRHGAAVILEIRSGEMFRAAYQFYVTPNGVWLTDHVPAKFIRRIS